MFSYSWTLQSAVASYAHVLNINENLCMHIDENNFFPSLASLSESFFNIHEKTFLLPSFFSSLALVISAAACFSIMLK
jgi:hypothetical protein